MDGQDRISSYNVKQTSDEKIEKYLLADYHFLQ